METKPSCFDARLGALPKLGYSLEEAAVVAEVSLATLTRAIKAGELRAVRNGQRRAIPRGDLEAYWALRVGLKGRGAIYEPPAERETSVSTDSVVEHNAER
jgi:excisionase family DNA binding protein